MPAHAPHRLRPAALYPEPLEGRLLLATYTVSVASDSGAGSLRQAILDANSNGGLDTILFSIGSGTRTIAPLTALPTISDPVVIDATAPGTFSTQIIELSGASAPATANGLKITAGGSTVRKLVINRFGANGIELQGGSGNIIEGCRIGTDVNGTSDLGNADDGVDINGSSNNRIGGTTTPQRNVISGNNSDGIDIGPGSSGNVIQGNYIGIRATGAASVPNSSHGVRITDGSSNTIGGTVAGSGNVISGNSSDGVRISGAPATLNRIQGNLIGLNPAGTSALANGSSGAGNGVMILLASQNLIGGTDADDGALDGTVAARNIISGNVYNGVEIGGAGGTASQNLVQGNFIGTNAIGTAAVPNGNDGIAVVRAAGNTIGGVAAGAGNTLAGNGDDGVELHGAEATANLVAGNRIGVRPDGNAALGNTSDGIEIEGAIGNTIGGTSPEARNIISGNQSDGIELWGGVGEATGTPSGNLIRGNYIGPAIDGVTLIGNAQFGISVRSGNSNAIGGVGAGEANLIAGNGASSDGGGGVSVEAGTGNSIRGNSIHQNAPGTVGSGLGIDLGAAGVTANDPLDADTGANDLQNHPQPAAVSSVGGSTTIHGSLSSTASTNITLDFYSSPSADPTGRGEGATYIGSSTVTTRASGITSFFVTLPITIATGQFVTATATNPSGSTSEFSAAVVASDAPAVQSITINDGAGQRSMVNSVTVVFNQPVALDTGAITVVGRDGAGAGTVAAAASTDGQTYVVTFTGSPIIGGSLADGIYDLTVVAANVHPAGNPGVSMTSDATLAFHRLYSDVDGDGDSDNADLFQMRSTYGKFSNDAAYRWWWDYTSDGDVDNADVFQVRSRRPQLFAGY